VFVVDASVWVSRYLPPDENHAASSEWLSRTLGEGESILAPTLLLAELTGPVSRAVSELEARRVLSEVSRLLAVRLVPLMHELGLLAALTAAQFRLRGADAVYVALARQFEAPLVTWDAEQLERGALTARAVTPAQLLEVSG
jgi:predicted nucleic acid-binding protein